MASRKAYDLLVQAESRLASITRGPEAPSRVGISIVDIATGATAYAAILEALIERARTGQGTEIDLSMFDVMADWLTVPLARLALSAVMAIQIGLGNLAAQPNYQSFVKRQHIERALALK